MKRFGNWGLEVWTTQAWVEIPRATGQYRAMKSLAPTARMGRWFDDYASHHQTAGNKRTHQVGIPLILLGLLGLFARCGVYVLGSSGVVQLDGGIGLWGLAGLWYLILDWKLALPFGLFSLGLYFLGRVIPVPVLFGFFILGWALQFFGHSCFEKKSPAFYSNLRHLLIGPIWIFAQWVDYTREDLH